MEQLSGGVVQGWSDGSLPSLANHTENHEMCNRPFLAAFRDYMELSTFWISSFQNYETIVLSHPVSGALFWHSHEMDTPLRSHQSSSWI